MLKIFLGKNEKLIPETWNEITIEQYIKITKCDFTDREIYEKYLVNLFTNLSEETMDSMNYEEFYKLYQLIMKVIGNIDNKISVDKIKHKGKLYELVKNPYKLKTQDFYNLCLLSKTNIIENIHKIIPLIYKNKKSYLNPEDVLNMNCDIALSAINFIIPPFQK